MTSILVILTWILFVLVLLYQNRNLAYPPTLLGILWGGYVVVGLIIFTPFYSWNYTGIYFILLSIFIFIVNSILGSNLFVLKHRKDNRIGKAGPFKSFIPYLLMLIFTFSGMLFPIILIYRNGFSLQSLFNMNTLISLNRHMALGRYSDASVYYNQFSQIFLMSGYTAALIGGYNWVYTEKRNLKILCGLTLLPSTVTLIISNGKAGLIISIVLWLSSYLVGRQERFKKLPGISYEHVKSIMKVIIILLLFFYASFFLRYGGFALNKIEMINNRILMYAFGHIPSFDNLFSNGSIENLSYGYNTFEGFFRLFTRQARESISYPWLYLDIGGTNVGTVLWGIISDFGYVGSIILIAFFGLITGMVYGRVTYTNRPRPISSTILSISYSMIIYSFLVSILIYVSVVVSFAGFLIYLIIIKRYHHFTELNGGSN